MDCNGLEGVVVADTELSDVDGKCGRLVIRGHDVEELALRHDFESACALLWSGALADAATHAALRSALGWARVRAFARLPSLGDALAAANAMDALRAALAHLRADEIAPSELKLELTAAVAVFAAAWSRQREGLPALAPDASLGHAADYLRMAGATATTTAHAAADTERERENLERARENLERARALDAYLVTASDHGMNASTFTARVVASTQSDAVSAVVAAIGALKGPLHGGAPGPVLAMLDAIGTPERAGQWIARQLAAGQRIMGMGHRVYRVRDPRAAVLERAVEQLHAAGVRSNRLALARAVEAVAVASLGERRPERRLAANVEFYTAVILDAVGLPQPLFSATFAVARVAGWLAHIDEQFATGRLIRPASRYVGPMPEVCEAA
ncbi:MAG TPA: citrate synthase [Burkholderiaceae bacterium]|nr:citrate synthase [Burkholderiaceae bacterium]